MSSSPLNSNKSKTSIASTLATSSHAKINEQVQISSSMSTFSTETQTIHNQEKVEELLQQNNSVLISSINECKTDVMKKETENNVIKKIYSKCQLTTPLKKNSNFGILTSSQTKKTSISSSGSCLCRICQNNTCRERLISPCNCKGSLAYVHQSCLERWLNQSSRSYCELCLFQFDSILSQRYRLCESLRLWVRHPRNRHNLQSDILITCLLTIVTGGLIIVCIVGMQYFELEGYKLGISVKWTRGAISFFLSIVLTGYLISLYLLIKDQFLPWYRWWKHTVNVRLILTPVPDQDSRACMDV